MWGNDVDLPTPVVPKSKNGVLTQIEIDALDPAVFGKGYVVRDDGTMFWSDGVTFKPTAYEHKIYIDPSKATNGDGTLTNIVTNAGTAGYVGYTSPTSNS